jgi:hypothetical protein
VIQRKSLLSLVSPHNSHRCCDGSAAWQTGSLHFAQYQIFMALAWPVAATFWSKRTAPSLGRRLYLHTAQEGNWQSLHRVLRDAPKTLISFSHSAHFHSSSFFFVHFLQYQMFTVSACPVDCTFSFKCTAPSLSLRLYVHFAQVGNRHVWHRVTWCSGEVTFSLLHSTHILWHCVHTYVSCLTLRPTSAGENAARGFMVLHVAHF